MIMAGESTHGVFSFILFSSEIFSRGTIQKRIFFPGSGFLKYPCFVFYLFIFGEGCLCGGFVLCNASSSVSRLGLENCGIGYIVVEIHFLLFHFQLLFYCL